MKTPANLERLKLAHEKAVDAFAIKASLPFIVRMRWLLEQVRKEIPAIGGVVHCNGDSWLVPVGYPKVTSALIDYLDHEGRVYQDRLRDAMEDGSFLKCSSECHAYLREMNQITTYMEDSRIHTLYHSEVHIRS